MNSLANNESNTGSNKQGPKKWKVLDIGKAINERKQKQNSEEKPKMPQIDTMAYFFTRYYMPEAAGFSSYGYDNSMQVEPQKTRSRLQLKSTSFANKDNSRYQQEGWSSIQECSTEITGDDYSRSGRWNSQSKAQNSYHRSANSHTSESSKYNIEKIYKYRDLPEYKSLAKVKESFRSLNELHSFSPEWTGPAEFFAIRSSNDFDLHKAVKYGVWSSTKRNNPALQHAWEEMDRLNGKVFLFFTVVDDLDEYRGVAEMVSAVDTDVTFEYWYESKKFTGLFKLKWHYLQNLSYGLFDGISTYTGPVHLQRDGTRLSYHAGLQMLKIFDRELKPWMSKVDKNRGKLTPFELDLLGYPLPTSLGNGWLLDDFQFMDQHEKKMREERDMDMETFNQSISSRNSMTSEVIHSSNQGGYISSGYESSTHYSSKKQNCYNSGYQDSPVQTPASKPSPFQAAPSSSQNQRNQAKNQVPQEQPSNTPAPKPSSRFSKPSKGMFD